MKHLALVTTLLLASAAEVPAAPCRVPGSTDPLAFKWETPLGYDEIYPSHPQFPVSSWTFTQQRTYYGRLYKDTADDACELWAAKNSPTSIWTTSQRSIWKTKKISNYLYKCAFDCWGGQNSKGDGQVDEHDFSACPVNIYAADGLQTEQMCDADLAADRMPYTGLNNPNTNYVRGKDFTPTQVKNIKDANSRYGIIDPTTHVVTWIWFSDVDDIHLPSGEAVDPYAVLSGDPGTAKAPEVDHAIPQKDIYGCGCGTNSYSNALLTSHERNNSMSNNSQDKYRKAILAFYSTSASPRLVEPSPEVAALPWDQMVERPESAEDVDDTAGCSAGGAPGAGSLGFTAVALGLVVRRRRR